MGFVLGFATCFAIAVCAPSMFAAMKEKGVALVKKAFASFGEMD